MIDSKFAAFRVLLRKAMEGYPRTQADFAREATIAPETLNRMLNQAEISRPSKSTLKKLAGVARNQVTYQMLLESCGYTEKKADTRSVKDKYACFEAFVNHICSAKMVIASSLVDFVETAVMLYSDLDIVYDIGTTVSVRKEDTSCADYAALMTLSAKLDDTVSVMTDVLLYYMETVNDRNVIVQASNDVALTSQYHSEVASRILQLRKKALRQAKKVDLTNILCIQSTNSQNLLPATSEQRLLNAIFGDTLEEEQVFVSGIGFYMPHTLPEFVVRNFLMKHQDVLCKTEREAQQIQSYLQNEKDKALIFSSYAVDTTTGAGGNTWLGPIVNVICRETHLNVQGWLNAQYQGVKPVADCIVFACGMPWDFNEEEKYYNRQKLISTLDAYARELRCNVTSCQFEATLFKA